MELGNPAMWNTVGHLGGIRQQDTELQPWRHSEFLPAATERTLTMGVGEVSILNSQIMTWLLSPKMRRTDPLNESLPRWGSLLPTKREADRALLLHHPDQILDGCQHPASPSYTSAACPLHQTVQCWRKNGSSTEPAWVQIPVQIPGSARQVLQLCIIQLDVM